MLSCNILFDARNLAISPNEIRNRVNEYGNSHKDATEYIFQESSFLDKDGEVFIKCASCILSNFGMTRRGVFSANYKEKLQVCWHKIGPTLLDIHRQIHNSGKSRERYLLEISNQERQALTSTIWLMTKALLPITMSPSSYGLVGASKILFSVLPELVLPTDNTQWRQLFKTVDLGDVIIFMAADIKKWEANTGSQFDLMDTSKRLRTLPSVYNVMALAARPGLT